MVYHAKSLRCLGMTQMVVGVLMGIFGIADLAAIYHWSSFSACGLWIGAWVFLTGLFGYIGAKSDTNPNNCLIGLMLAFAVTACIFTGIMTIIYSVAVAEFAEKIRCKNYPYSYCLNYEIQYVHHDYSPKAGLALSVFLLLLAISQFFIALASSIYGCNACCCVAPTHIQTSQQVAYIGPQQGNVIVVPAGGYYAGSTVQTMTTYPGQQVPVLHMQGAQPVYPQQQYHGAPVQAYNPGPPMLPIQPGPANPQVFQAQNLPQVEKPPPYNYSNPQAPQ